MSKKAEIGYLCRHGHFQFVGDPEGDSCQTKIIGKVYVKPIRGLVPGTFYGAIAEALRSIHTKIEFWRCNA